MFVGQAGGHNTLLVGATASGELLPSTLITSTAQKATVPEDILDKLPSFKGKFGNCEEKRYDACASLQARRG